MKWEEVRTIYPNQYVLLEILQSHIKGDKQYVDEVSLIRTISDPREATKELLHAENGTVVYHTNNEKFVIHLRKRASVRGVIS
ncbi:hypothetical protein NC797_16745 [Aquibacillus sp. 3ASR75-11]|uniref:Uncharacterized protein n=1 Tax=Terrihalobacillus insolitus TaxID=2950438 RepID=A0A9X4AN83_9BACI|nr:hypothetical protein [Terrihalobacillus insolitus]MDC3426146.1 hypothetical protein [Terrihalobacillus insolitus]